MKKRTKIVVALIALGFCLVLIGTLIGYNIKGNTDFDSSQIEVIKIVTQSAYYRGLLQAYSVEYLLDLRDNDKYWRFIDTLGSYHIDSCVVENAFKGVIRSLDRALNDDHDISTERHEELKEKALELKKKVLERMSM